MGKIKIPLLILIIILIVSCNDRKNTSENTDNYAIVYNVLVSDSIDNYEVFSMNFDGSDKRNITNLPGVEWTYFSNKDKVLFISDKDDCFRCYSLYETNYKGDDPRKISDIRLADSWMSSRKNGTELIVKPHNNVISVFYILDLEGNILQSLETRMAYSADPLFVNEGAQVVFRGGLTKSKLVEGFNEALYIMDADGKNQKQLTYYPENDTTAGKFGYRAGTPKQHPLEKFISYQSKQNGKYSLYAVSLDGKKNWKLTENTQNEGWHDWSPDGKWLAIELFDDDQNQFHIGVMNWETKEMNILTDTTYRYQQSPNFVMKN
jgi:TolB protein